MPMELRSRRSLRPGVAREVELLDATTTTTPARRRRSTRPRARTTYEESDESDSESVQSREMESVQSPPAELEEEAVAAAAAAAAAAATEEEADVTDLKHCSVLLNRLQADDKAARKELDEKDDMNRKGGKPVSRIPTFFKRPSGASQSPELPAPKKDTTVQAAEPQEDSGCGSAEASKAKPPDVRDTALPLPSVRVPRMGLEAPSLFSSPEQAATTAHSSQITAPKSWGLSGSVQNPLLTVSPRPAIRPEHGSEQHLPEEEERKSSAVEADTVPDVPVRQLLPEASLSQKPQDDFAEKSDDEVDDRITPTTSEDTDKPESVEGSYTTEVDQVDAIMDEEAPWEKEPMNILELKCSRSSSDAESEESVANEKSEVHDVEEVKEHREAHIVQSEFVAQEKAEVDESTTPVAAETPEDGGSTRSTKSSGCPSVVLLFVLPTTLLLLGGLGQHVWHYGLPSSVAQLTAQLELHWLEGFGLVPEPCSTDCRVHLVESIPVGLYPSSPSSRRSIADSWLRLLDRANSSVHIAAFYFTLRAGDLENTDSDAQGRKVFEQLKQLESKGVQLQIAVNSPQESTQDTSELAATGAEVREVDLQAVTGGIVHTKLWVVDQKHFYLGSANMDWRSLSQVKEVGLSVEDCSCLAQDASRIFGVYWSVGGAHNGSLPPYWPARLSALSSSQNPLRLRFNGVPAQVYLSSAPPQISARGRSDDLSTILSVIGDARKFVYISVMDYLPLSQFTEPLRFWPPIDSALRSAACTRGVQVRLVVSCWDHSPAAMFTFLQSLLVLKRPPLKCDIDVKVFTVPSTAEQRTIPFARVNHAKYMVTDRVVYIGTSNWSENYFSHTAGVGLVVNQTGSDVGEGQRTLQSQAEELFLRDWTSQYSSPLSVDSLDVCPRGRH